MRSGIGWRGYRKEGEERIGGRREDRERGMRDGKREVGGNRKGVDKKRDEEEDRVESKKKIKSE